MKKLTKAIAFLSATAFAFSVFALSPLAAEAAGQNLKLKVVKHLMQRDVICEITPQDFKEIKSDGHPVMHTSVDYKGRTFHLARISKDYTSKRAAYRYLANHNMDDNCVIIPHGNYYYGLIER